MDRGRCRHSTVLVMSTTTNDGNAMTDHHEDKADVGTAAELDRDTVADAVRMTPAEQRRLADPAGAALEDLTIVTEALTDQVTVLTDQIAQLRRRVAVLEDPADPAAAVVREGV